MAGIPLCRFQVTKASLQLVSCTGVPQGMEHNIRYPEKDTEDLWGIWERCAGYREEPSLCALQDQQLRLPNSGRDCKDKQEENQQPHADWRLHPILHGTGHAGGAPVPIQAAAPEEGSWTAEQGLPGGIRLVLVGNVEWGKAQYIVNAVLAYQNGREATYIPAGHCLRDYGNVLIWSCILWQKVFLWWKRGIKVCLRVCQKKNSRYLSGENPILQRKQGYICKIIIMISRMR